MFRYACPELWPDIQHDCFREQNSFALFGMRWEMLITKLQLVLDLSFYIVLPSRRRGSLCYGSLHQIYCPHRSSENHNKQKQMSHCLVTWRFSRKLRSAIRANHIIYLPPTPSTHSLIISFSLKNITAVLGEHNWTYLRSHPVVFVWIYVQCNIFRSLIDWRSPYLFWSILVARAQ